MFETENLSCDVLVIGSGVAGLEAALEAGDEGLAVLLISKGPIATDSCSYYSGGGFKPRQWLESFALEGDIEGEEDLIGDECAIQRYLHHPELVDMIAQRTQKDIEYLISSLGLPMVRHPYKPGKYCPDRKGLDKQSGPPGAVFMLPMVKKARELGVTCLDRTMAIDFLVNEGRIKGALALNKEGKLLKIACRAIILATGGGGDAYEHNSNPVGIVGDGYILALTKGAVLENMELVEFHALGIEETSGGPPGRISPSVIIDYDGPVMLNGKGENIVDKHLRMTLRRAIDIPVVKFEVLPLIIAQEAKNNGGAYIDLTGISARDWDDILANPFLKAYFNRAPYLRKQKWPLQPMAQAFDGGVRIDLKAATTVPGLLAAGQVVGGIAGVSYPLSRCLTLGAVAGRSAASFVKESKPVQVRDSEWQASLSKVKAIVETNGTEKPEELKQASRRVLYEAGGPLRDGPAIEQGIKDLEALEKRTNSVKVESPAQLKDALETENILLLGKAILGAALRREESRGPHFRSDFPHKDAAWFKRILVSMDKKDGELVFGEEKVLSQQNP